MKLQKDHNTKKNNREINLFAISTAKNTNQILDDLLNLSLGEINLNIHFGDVSNQFKASSLVRMNNKKGTSGHFSKNKNFYGFDYQLISSPHFKRFRNVYRSAIRLRSYRYKSHNLQNLQDYLDYYYILSDAVAELFVSNQINHVLFFNIPHLAYDTIVYQVAKALDIEITIVTQSLISNKFFSLKTIENYGLLNETKNLQKIKKIKLPELNLFYMKKIKQEYEKNGNINIRFIINFILYIVFKKPNILFQPIYIWKILTRIKKIYNSFPRWRDPFANFFHTNELAYFEHLAEFENTKYNINDKFVYFPLPMQEMTTSAIGGVYRDQVLAIEGIKITT